MKKILTVAFSVLLSIAITGCNSASNNIKFYDSVSLSSEIPVVYNDACFIVDVNKPAEVVGWGDYVFVAKINKEIRTEYSNLRKNENETVTGKPHTVYDITIVDNLKGNLIKNESIEFIKHGGVNYDGASISLLEGDQLLESGKYYILIAASDTNGKLAQGIANASIELDISNAEELTTNEIYQAYQKYVETEVQFERVRYHSIYEEK